ncbi:organic hydroperoxide resistance protein, partial [Oenococcus oeni]
INTGGRSGESHSPNHSFELNIEQPGSKVSGTNPEELFAAGYSACFNSALDYIKKSDGINGSSTVKVRVSLYNQSQNEIPDVVLGVEIKGVIEGISLDKAQALLNKAHETCPYSRAV